MEGQHYVTKEQLYDYLYPKALKVALRSTWFDTTSEELQNYRKCKFKTKLWKTRLVKKQYAFIPEDNENSSINSKQERSDKQASWNWTAHATSVAHMPTKESGRYGIPKVSWNCSMLSLLFVFNLLKTTLQNSDLCLIVKNYHLYPKLLLELVNGSIRECGTCKYCVNKEKIEQTSLNVLDANLYESLYSYKDLRIENIVEILSPMRALYFSQNELNKLLSRLKCCSHRLSSILDDCVNCFINQTSNEKQTIHYGHTKNFKYHVFGSHILCNTRSHLIWIYKGKSYIYQIEYLVLVYNKLSDIISVLECNRFMSKECYSELDTKYLIPFINSLAQMADELQGQFFAYAKTIEAFNVGITLKEVDGQENSHFDKMLCETLLEDTGIDPRTTMPYQILTYVTTPYRHELATLTKILGHPFVDMKGGAVKLEGNVNKEIAIDDDLVSDLVRMSKKNIIKQFLRVVKTWPKIESQTGLHPILVESLRTNKDPDILKHKYRNPPLSIYDKVVFVQQFELDYLENFLPYLKDRTITQPQSFIKKGISEITSVNQNLFEANFKAPYRNKIEYLKNTRLLFHYIMNQAVDLDHKKFVEEYQDYSKWEFFLDLTTIRIVPKEKELKELFRGFGCQSYMQRARCLVQESNSKKFLSKFSDEHSMTLGELESARKIQGMRMIGKMHKKHQVIYINVDADKWNNFFRDGAIGPPSEHVLDKLYGTTLFKYTHKYYQKCWMYVPDGENLYYWNGQQGGIEGLNQDTWVVHYINMIHVALKDIGIPYYLLCKGDDLRVAVAVPPYLIKDKSIDTVRVYLIQIIKEKCAGFGQTIKIDDSYASSTYFNFNKIASVGSIELPQTFRKIQKVYGENNAMRRSIDLYISGCFSNAHSASNVSMAPMSCYWVACCWASYYVAMDGVLQDLNIIQSSALLLVPSCVGGMPIIYFHNIHTRGESDLLSSFIYMIQTTYMFNAAIACEMAKFLYKSRFKERNADMVRGLLMDPYSLPVNKPPLPESVLYSKVRQHLPKITKNEIIDYFLSDSMIQADKDIVEFFSKSTTYDARVMSAIYACTPYQLGAEFVKRFETSSTIFDCLCAVVGQQECVRILKRSVMAETTLKKWRRTVLHDAFNPDNFCDCLPEDWMEILYCPGKLANDLRFHLWGKEVHSVTIPPVTHQITLVKSTLRNELITERDRQNHFGLHVKPFTIENYSHNYHPSFQTGPYPPFIGTRTNAAMKESTDTFVKNNMFLSRIGTLLDLHSWCSTISPTPVPTMYTKLIENLVNCYLPDYNFNVMRTFQRSVRGGTIQHHVRSRGFKEEIIPNVLNNFFTRCYGSTDTHHYIRRNERMHYNLNFLLCYVISVNNIFLRKSLENTLNLNEQEIWFLVTPNCDFCMKEITCGSLISEKEAPSIPKFSYLSLHSYEENILKSLNNALGKAEISTATQLSVLMKEDIEFPDACKAFLGNYVMLTQLRQLHTLERHAMASADQESIEILEYLTGQKLTLSEGRTELKLIPIHLIFHISAITACSHFIERSFAINCTSLDTFSIIENHNMLPFFSILYNLNMIGRLPEVIKHMHQHTKPGQLNDTPNLLEIVRAFTLHHESFIAKQDLLKIDVMLPLEKSELIHYIVSHLRTLINILFNKLSTMTSVSLINPPFERMIHNLRQEDFLEEWQYGRTLSTIHLLKFLVPHIINQERVLEMLEPGETSITNLLIDESFDWSTFLQPFFEDERSRTFTIESFSSLCCEVQESDIPYDTLDHAYDWIECDDLQRMTHCLFEGICFDINVYEKGSVHHCIRSCGDFQGNMYTQLEKLRSVTHLPSLLPSVIIPSSLPGSSLILMTRNEIGYTPFPDFEQFRDYKLNTQALCETTSADNGIVLADIVVKYLSQSCADHNLDIIYCPTLIIMNDHFGHGTRMIMNYIKPKFLVYHQHGMDDGLGNKTLPFNDTYINHHQLEFYKDQFRDNTVDLLSPSYEELSFTSEQSRMIMLFYFWTPDSKSNSIIDALYKFKDRYKISQNYETRNVIHGVISMPINEISEDFLIILHLITMKVNYDIWQDVSGRTHMVLFLYQINLDRISEIYNTSRYMFHRGSITHLENEERKASKTFKNLRLKIYRAPNIIHQLEVPYPTPIYMDNIIPLSEIYGDLRRSDLHLITEEDLLTTKTKLNMMCQALSANINNLTLNTQRSRRSIFFNQVELTQYTTTSQDHNLLYDVTTRSNLLHLSRQLFWYKGATFGLIMLQTSSSITSASKRAYYKQAIDNSGIDDLFGSKQSDRYDTFINDRGFIIDLNSPFLDGIAYILRCYNHVLLTL